MTPGSRAAALLLAAGKGTRMKSDLAKVLFLLGGKPLILHVIDAVEGAGIGRTVVVVGHQRERVADALIGRRVELVVQDPQLGTGHAAQCAAPVLSGFAGTLVVLAGDAPFIRSETIRDLIERHESSGAAVTVLTARVPDPAGYGRIVREGGRVTGIVEEKDASPEVREIREINSSIYAFRYSFLQAALPRLRAENRQKELYLTDTVHMAFTAGDRVEGFVVADPHEISGINTPEQLAEAERLLEERSRG
jgi:UDP-N-acetylglucosamine diphosphorylase/glucosamine-1-phosphate N-acetyltransferase